MILTFYSEKALIEFHRLLKEKLRILRAKSKFIVESAWIFVLKTYLLYFLTRKTHIFLCKKYIKTFDWTLNISCHPYTELEPKNTLLRTGNELLSSDTRNHRFDEIL